MENNGSLQRGMHTCCWCVVCRRQNTTLQVELEVMTIALWTTIWELRASHFGRRCLFYIIYNDLKTKKWKDGNRDKPQTRWRSDSNFSLSTWKEVNVVLIMCVSLHCSQFKMLKNAPGQHLLHQVNSVLNPHAFKVSLYVGGFLFANIVIDIYRGIFNARKCHFENIAVK